MKTVLYNAVPSYPVPLYPGELKNRDKRTALAVVVPQVEHGVNCGVGLLLAERGQRSIDFFENINQHGA